MEFFLEGGFRGCLGVYTVELVFLFLISDGYIFFYFFLGRSGGFLSV